MTSLLQLSDFALRVGDLHLQVNAEFSGKVTGIFGPSGAGKTTILEAIAGLRKPGQGRIAVAGVVLTDVSRAIHVPPELRRIGYVPQDLALFPHLSVRQNLLFGANTDSKPTITLDHISEVLEIRELLDRSTGGLSGGEKQRTAFARALLAAPRLLLMDEPLSGLDSALRERMTQYLLRVRDEFEIPMVYVSHDPDELAKLCDEIVVLREGRMIARGSTSDIFTRISATRYVYDGRGTKMEDRG